MERYWLPVAYLLMEAGWSGGGGLALGARLSPAEARPILSLPLALLTLVAAYATGLRLIQRDLDAGGDRGRRRAGFVPVAALALGLCWTFGAVWIARHWGDGPTWLEALPTAASGVWTAATPDALSLALVFGLWWRGQRTGAIPPEHDSTVRAFGVGALALSGALLLGAGLYDPQLNACVLLFLAGGLPALSLARLQDVRRDLDTGAVRGEPARLDAAWWRTLAPPVLVIVAVAIVTAAAFGDPRWRDAMGGVLSGAAELVFALLYWPVVLLGLIAEWLIVALRSLIRPTEDGTQVAPPPGQSDDLLRQLRERSDAPPEWFWLLRWAAVAIAAALVLVSFLASSRVVQRGRAEEAAATTRRESLGAWQRLLADLRLALALLLRRLRSRGARVLSDLPLTGARRTARRRAAEIDDARGAYRRLLALGREHAAPRRVHQTPDEYLGTWRAVLPAAEEAGELTLVYRRARYGASDRPLAAPSRLRALVAKIHDALTASKEVS